MNNTGLPASPHCLGNGASIPCGFVIPACLWSQFHQNPIQFDLFPSHALKNDSPQLLCFICTGALVCNILSDWHTCIGTNVVQVGTNCLCVRYLLVYDLPHCMPTCSSYNNNNMLKLIYSTYNYACT